MENEELVEQIKAGNNKTKYLEQLYLQNRNFIYGIAKKYSPYAEMDDLMQEAYFGLVKAVEGFESKQGANFLTYLAYWLQSVFRRYIDNFGNTKRISASMRERILKYKKYLAECAKMEQTATDYAICRELNISEKQLANLRKTIYEAECISVNELLPGSDNLTIEEAIADPLNMEEGIVDTLSEEWLKVQLWKIVDELGDKQRTVINGHFKELETLKDIAKKLNISVTRVERIQVDALQILRRKKLLKKIAEDFGYWEGSRAYKGGLKAFKNNGASVVEIIAMEHIRQEKREARLQRRIIQNKQNISNTLNTDELFEQILNLASGEKGTVKRNE